jgi:hypothetical protein
MGFRQTFGSIQGVARWAPDACLDAAGFSIEIFPGEHVDFYATRLGLGRCAKLEHVLVGLMSSRRGRGIRRDLLKRRVREWKRRGSEHETAKERPG